MNRRSFLAALGAFAILPPATTYSRVWRADRSEIMASHYRANRLGVYAILMECHRSVDMTPAPANMAEISELIFSINRTRKPGPVEIYTDAQGKAWIQEQARLEDVAGPNQIWMAH